MSKNGDKEDPIGSLASSRGRASAEEGTRLLIAISTGSLGVFFVALTQEIQPPLDLFQQISAIVAVLAMGIASGNGLMSWWIDAKSNIYWALARSEEDKKIRSKYYKDRDRWRKYEKVNNRVFFVMFPLGIVAAVTFLIQRILSA